MEAKRSLLSLCLVVEPLGEIRGAPLCSRICRYIRTVYHYNYRRQRHDITRNEGGRWGRGCGEGAYVRPPSLPPLDGIGNCSCRAAGYTLADRSGGGCSPAWWIPLGHLDVSILIYTIRTRRRRGRIGNYRGCRFDESIIS